MFRLNVSVRFFFSRTSLSREKISKKNLFQKMKSQNLFSYLLTLALMGRIHCNKDPKNVFGDDLKICSTDPVTGWNRDGLCQTDESDQVYWLNYWHTLISKDTSDTISNTN